MNNESWLAPVFNESLRRESKPRDRGLTMVMDKGLSPPSLRAILDNCGEYVDQLKLSFGTSAFMEESIIRSKISICRDRGVLIYPGGTLFELAHRDGDITKYFHCLSQMKFNAVEISSGIIDLPPAQRGDLIRRASNHGFSVIAEVGKKDPDRQPDPSTLAEQLDQDQRNGANYSIVESRESGRGIGIYDEEGDVEESSIETIVNSVPNLDDLIWEAPKTHQQAYLIKRFGENVNLGNIPVDEVLALEALRHGYRWDTVSYRAQEKTIQQ